MIAATAIEIVTGRETVIESETRAGIGTGTVIATVIEIETVTVTEIGIGTRIGAGIVIESGTATVIGTGTGTGTGKETTRTGALVITQRCSVLCLLCLRSVRHCMRAHTSTR
jgi:hypothetical protein